MIVDNLQSLVVEYFEASGQANRLPIRHKKIRERQYRQIIHQQSISFLKKAMDAHDADSIARLLAKTIYELVGTATAYGIDISPVLLEVHKEMMLRANEQNLAWSLHEQASS